MSANRSYALAPDRTGAVWDLLLYVPTVIALASVGVKLWFGDDRPLAYVLSFLASFFLLVGANRILKTRLLIVPAAPVAVELDADVLTVVLRNARRIDLVKQARYYGDVSGRSFGVSGLDRDGKRLQFVFHRGQFSAQRDYDGLREAIQRLQKRTQS